MKKATNNLEKELGNKLISLEVEKSYRKLLKQGIYKELHRRSLLSNKQLNALMSKK